MKLRSGAHHAEDLVFRDACAHLNEGNLVLAFVVGAPHGDEPARVVAPEVDGVVGGEDEGPGVARTLSSAGNRLNGQVLLVGGGEVAVEKFFGARLEGPADVRDARTRLLMRAVGVHKDEAPSAFRLRRREDAFNHGDEAEVIVLFHEVLYVGLVGDEGDARLIGAHSALRRNPIGAQPRVLGEPKSRRKPSRKLFRNEFSNKKSVKLTDFFVDFNSVRMI